MHHEASERVRSEIALIKPKARGVPSEHLHQTTVLAPSRDDEEGVENW